MADNVLGQRQTEGMEHDWPVNCVETDDFFPHHVNVSGPVLLEETVIGGTVTQCSDIVGQGVNPHINHVLRVVRHLDSPVKGSPGDGQVFQSRFQEVVDHLVHPGVRFNKVRVLFVVLHQPVSVLAHLEEVGFFLNQLNFVTRRGLPTDDLAIVIAVHFCQLAFSEVFFIIDRIPARVLALVNITLVEELLENLLDGLLVVVVSRSDKFVVGNL